MTKEQKLDIERWISIQVLKLQKAKWHECRSQAEDLILQAKIDTYEEIRMLLDGKLIVSDDYTELRPA